MSKRGKGMLMVLENILNLDIKLIVKSIEELINGWMHIRFTKM